MKLKECYDALSEYYVDIGESTGGDEGGMWLQVAEILKRIEDKGLSPILKHTLLGWEAFALGKYTYVYKISVNSPLKAVEALQDKLIKMGKLEKE